MTYHAPRYLTDKPAGELFTPAHNAVPSPVSRTFVRHIRQAALRRGMDVAADHLLSVMNLMKGGDYNGAVSYAKEHGFDLETLNYSPRSGVLESNWSRMVEAIQVWGTRPEFLNMDKPLHTPHAAVSVPVRRKYEADMPYKR